MGRMLALDGGGRMADKWTEEELAFLDRLTASVGKARREGALIGSLYTFLALSMLYVAFAKLGPTHAVSALCYGGVVVLAVDGYRRVIRRP